MFYDATGREDPDGDLELKNGSLVVRDGKTLRFNRFMCDAAPSAAPSFHDAKVEPPKTIDEALQRHFEALAKQRNTTVRELLAVMGQKEIEKTAAEIAAQFVSAKAGHGVAEHFSNDSVVDCATIYRVAAARYKAEMARRPFTWDDAAAAAGKAAVAKIAIAIATDSSAEVERLRSEAKGARAAWKHLVSNAWRH